MSNDCNIIIPIPDTFGWRVSSNDLDPHSALSKALKNGVLVIGSAVKWGQPPALMLTDKAKEWMELTGLHGNFLNGKTRAMICFDDYFAAGLFRMAFEL